MDWLPPAFLAAVALLIFLQRRSLARAQALVLGGTVMPGCVVAEALVVLAIAIAMVLLR